MYSLQLRRGLARGRIWHTSAIYQNSRLAGEEPSEYHYQQSQTRDFHGSRWVGDGAKGDGGSGNGGPPREIPKLNFADLVKKAGTLRQAMFKRPPPTEQSSAPAATTAPTPTPQSSPSPAVSQVRQPIATTPPSYQQQQQQSQPSQYQQQGQRVPKPLPSTYKPPLAPTGPPKIRKQMIGAAAPQDVSSLMSQSAQTAPQSESAARVQRINRMRARIRRYDTEPELKVADREDREIGPQDEYTNINERQVARAQERAFAQVNDSSVIERSLTPAGASVGFTGSGSGGTSARFTAGRDRDGNTAKRLAGRLSARGGRGGRGGGGGRGGRGGARGGKEGGKKEKMSANARLEEMRAEEEFEREWVEMTAHPEKQEPGEIEAHPVYDSTRPYFADTADIHKWIPAVGGGASHGARKLVYMGKPKHEPMLKWTARALCGDGILIPGQEFVREMEGVEKGGKVEKMLSRAEEGLMKNASFKDRQQEQFLDIVRAKLGVKMGEVRA
ncbi:hypothetical protein TWF694_008454 [Orbilia ellipsospora]|uniref:Uncharacterized protein n=1 Tax=Orbilia ellipsospora TaxID=2528407 RepID=A0AAV9XGM7_9PEZI